MPRYTIAIVLLLDTLLTAPPCLALTQNRVVLSRNTLLSVGSSSDSMKRPASIAASISEQDRDDGRLELQQAFSTSVSYLESLSQSASDIIQDNLNDIEDDFTSSSTTTAMTQPQSPRVVLDIDSQKRSYRFDIYLPTASAVTSSTCIGLAIRRISQNGIVSDSALDFDTLSFISHEDEKFRTPTIAGGRSINGEGVDSDVGVVQLLSDKERLKCQTAGLIVSSVVRGSLAWEAGVRAGDFLVATSATIGDVSGFLFILLLSPF
jgi:hypothetical protein